MAGEVNLHEFDAMVDEMIHGASMKEWKLARNVGSVFKRLAKQLFTEFETIHEAITEIGTARNAITANYTYVPFYSRLNMGSHRKKSITMEYGKNSFFIKKRF